MMKRAFLPFLFLLFVSSGDAQTTFGPLADNARSLRDVIDGASRGRAAVKQQPVEAWFPQLIIGGEWATTIRLTNRGTKAIPTTNVYFADNLGNDLKATFQITGGSVITDVGFSFSLAVGGVLESTFFGTDTPRFGFAIVDGQAINFTSSGLYAEVALRNRNASRPDFESVFPLEQPATTQYMLFDGRNGYTTVLYVVSGNTAAADLSIDVVDPNGSIRRTVRLPLKALESQLLQLHVIAPETIGIQGSLVFRGQGSNLFVVTALRISPSNSFTPLRSWVPTQ